MRQNGEYVNVVSSTWSAVTIPLKLCYNHYSNTTRNNILFIDVSASRQKPSSGLTSGTGRQYVKSFGTHEDERTVLFKTISLSLILTLKLTVKLTLIVILTLTLN